MSKIFNEATLSLVWDMVHVEKRTMKQICIDLCTEMPHLNKMYAAAYRRFGCNQHSNRKREDKVVKITNKPKSSFERPPSNYSNKNFSLEIMEETYAHTCI